jgi:hypothetical protein
LILTALTEVEYQVILIYASLEPLNSLSKLEIFKSRQDSFLKVIQTETTWDIVGLDITARSTPTLRTIVTDMKSVDKPHLNLFHSVDEHWRGGHVFHFMPQLADEAKMMLRNLIPFLRHEYSSKVDNYFTADAIQSAEGATWDPDLKRVVCQTDTNLDNLCDIEDDGLGLQEAVAFISSKEEAEKSRMLDANNLPRLDGQRPPVPVTAADAYYNETDSVSTLDTTYTSRGAFSIGRSIAPSVGNRSGLSDTFIPALTSDSQSVASAVTMESFTTLSSTVQSLQANQNQVEQTLQLILSRLPVPQTEGASNSSGNEGPVSSGSRPAGAEL